MTKVPEVERLRKEVADYEQTDLVPRSRYDALEADWREAREQVRIVADRATAEIERLQSMKTDTARLAAEEIADYVSDGVLGMGNEVTEANRAKFLEIVSKHFVAAPD